LPLVFKGLAVWKPLICLYVIVTAFCFYSEADPEAAVMLKTKQPF